MHNAKATIKKSSYILKLNVNTKHNTIEHVSILTNSYWFTHFMFVIKYIKLLINIKANRNSYNKSIDLKIIEVINSIWTIPFKIID